MFHMHNKKMYKRDITCSCPPVTNCHTFSDPHRTWRTLWTAPMDSNMHWIFIVGSDGHGNYGQN